MSSVQFKDSKCYICGRQTPMRCDSCKRFVCDNHYKIKDLPHNVKKLLFCDECIKKGAINKTTHIKPDEMW